MLYLYVCCLYVLKISRRLDKGMKHFLKGRGNLSVVDTHFKFSGSKRMISFSGEFELLQIISEPDIGRCANENSGPKEAGL